jgi:hypothetical protein
MADQNQIFVNTTLNAGATLHTTVHGEVEINEGGGNCGTVIGNINVRKGGNHGKSCPTSTLCTGKVVVDAEGEIYGQVLGEVVLNAGAIAGSPNQPAVVTGKVVIRNNAIINNVTVYGDARVQRLANTANAAIYGAVTEYKVGPYINAYYGDNGEIASATVINLPTPALDGPANVYYNYSAGSSNPANGYYSTGRYLNGGITTVPVPTPRPAIDDGIFRVYNVAGRDNAPTQTPTTRVASGVYSNGYFQSGTFYYPAFGEVKPSVPLDIPAAANRRVYFQGADAIFDAYSGLNAGTGGTPEYVPADPGGTATGSAAFAAGTDRWEGDTAGWSGYSSRGWVSGPYTTGFYNNGYLSTPPTGTGFTKTIDGNLIRSTTGTQTSETTLAAARYNSAGEPLELNKGYLGNAYGGSTSSRKEIWVPQNQTLGLDAEVFANPNLSTPLAQDFSYNNFIYSVNLSGVIDEITPLPTGYTSTTPIAGMGSFPNSTNSGSTTIVI